MLTALDEKRLGEALQAARGAIGLSDPNPRVGCVLGRGEKVLAIGHTQQVGGPHAEAMALAQAQAAGLDLRGATAWVSLEPCSHHGRTPPCCDALIAAGITRVVVATGDANPLVAGQGLARLRAAGIAVDVAEGSLSEAARELNVGFFSRFERGRPWVRLKMATSLDGRVALNNGSSQWITGSEARADGHRWRKRAGAILTGVGTVLADDPRLDVRLTDTHRQPLRVVLDSSLRTPASARMLQAPGQALVLTAAVQPERAQALGAAGAEVKALPTAAGTVDLEATIRELARREINEVHVEAGPTLGGALIAAGWVDELLVYVAPVLLGPGLGAVSWPALTRLDQASRWRFVDQIRLGEDLRSRLLRTTGDRG